MSETLRIALVAEGVTDYEFLRAAIAAMLGDRAFLLKLIQPPESEAFSGGGDAGQFGGGWRGVYRFCIDALERTAGNLVDDPLLHQFDLLILHLDADVAGEDPASHPRYPLPQLQGVLPCQHACPPATATTDPLRAILTQWLGVPSLPQRTILCTPSKSLETWVVAACFPNDTQMIRSGWECYPTPEVRLSQQPKRVRFAKSQSEYRKRHDEFRNRWPVIVDRLTEARRFQSEFQQTVSSL